MKDNKLISDFMGGKPRLECNDCNYNHDCNHIECKLTEGGQIKMLRYHTSWDWLMPCVEKIESLTYDVRINGYGSEGDDKYCDICDGNDEISEFTSKSKIEAVYKSVVEFIHWYNKNK